MRRESEGNPFDRLSRSDQEVLRHPQIRTLLRGCKPAVFLAVPNDNPPIKNPKAISEALASMGIDAMVFHDLIIDTRQIAARVAKEPDLADEVGWDRKKSVEENLRDGGPFYTTGKRDDALVGFVLGFPGSAIRSFERRDDLKSMGIPTPPNGLFEAEFVHALLTRITDAEDKALYDRILEMVGRAKVERKNAVKKSKSMRDRHAANERFQEALHMHDQEMKRLLGKYLSISEDDLDRLFSPRQIALENKDGEMLYYFVTSGTNSENSPDILELETRLAKIEGPITKVVNGK